MKPEQVEAIAEQRLAEYMTRKAATLAEYGDRDHGPEITAISKKAILQVVQVDLARKDAERRKVNAGQDLAHQSHLQLHCGLRAALLTATMVRYPELDDLQADWLADRLSGRDQLGTTNPEKAKRRCDGCLRPMFSGERLYEVRAGQLICAGCQTENTTQPVVFSGEVA